MKKAKAAILGDHKRIGKRFIPPLAQLDFQSVSYIEVGIPELLWIALLQRSIGQHEAAEVAATIAKMIPKQEGGPPRWCACATIIGELDKAAQDRVLEGLRDQQEPVAKSLEPLARQYPSFPMGFLTSAADSDARRAEDLALLKSVVASLFVKRGVDGIRMQATGIYMAFMADQLKVAPHTNLASFPEIEKYPHTEKSKDVAAVICATVNGFLGMTISGPSRTKWAHYFWNRGFELEPIDSGLIDRLAEPGAFDAE